MNRFCRLLMLVLLILIISACKSKKDNTALRIGIIKPSINHLPLSLALQKNYLHPDKYKLITFTSGWEVQEAISAGRIDLAIMPFTYAWTAVAKGRKIKIISCLERETDGIVTKTDFNDISDLQNRKIGLLRASTLEILMQDIAERNDIVYLPVYFRTPTEMIAALQTNDVDAIVSYVPLIQKMSSDYHVLHWFSETYPNHPCCDLVATEYVTSARESDLNLILSALVHAAADIANPSEEIYALLSSLYGLDKQQAIEALQHTKFDVSLKESDIVFEQEMMNAFVNNSYISKLPPLQDVYYKQDN